MSTDIDTRSKKTVLLIEDDPTQWFYMKRMLSSHYDVRHASNGIEALRLLELHAFDLILMDINLGDEMLSGFHLVNYIRKQEKFQGVKIFAVTAESFESRDGHSSFSFSSFDKYIAKPVEKDRLIEAIESAMVIHPYKT